jgi:hypothetical protein
MRGRNLALAGGRGGEGCGEVERQRVSEDGKVGNWIASALFERQPRRQLSMW